MNKIFILLKSFSKKKYFPLFCYLWVGVLSFFAFIPYKLTHLVWIVPFGVFWLEEKYRNNNKKLIYHGLGMGLALNIFSYIWINHLLITFGGFPFIIAFFLFLLYSIVTVWKFPVYMILFGYLRKKFKKKIILISVFSILVAELFTFQLFPWYFGNLLAGNKFLAQNVEYTGVYGLSGLVFLISYFLYRTIWMIPNLKNPNTRRRFFKIAALPIAVLLIFSLNGTYLYHKWQNVKPASTKQVLMIQPDAPLEFRDGRSVKETIEDLMNRIESFSIKSADEQKPDLIVLPESGIPFFSTHNIDATNLFNRSYYEKFETLMYLLAIRNKSNVYFNEVDAMFVDGKVHRDNQRFYNSSVVFDQNGNRKESYHKSYLLAFGEYLPGGELFPSIYKMVPQVARFLPGKENNLLSYYKNKNELPEFKKSHLKLIDSSFMNLKSIKEYYKDYETEVEEEGKFLPLICYEVIIPEFVRKFSKSGNPDFIINITNDKWYGNNRWYSSETFEHLELARLRSIEFRRWMVRSTNSGTSVFVDHLGNIVNDTYTSIEAPDFYSSRISIIKSGPTFYVLFGNILVWAFIIGFLAFLLAGKYLKK